MILPLLVIQHFSLSLTCHIEETLSFWLKQIISRNRWHDPRCQITNCVYKRRLFFIATNKLVNKNFHCFVFHVNNNNVIYNNSAKHLNQQCKFNQQARISLAIVLIARQLPPTTNKQYKSSTKMAPQSVLARNCFIVQNHNTNLQNESLLLISIVNNVRIILLDSKNDY